LRRHELFVKVISCHKMCVTKLPFDWYTTLDTSDNIGGVERLLNDLNPELLKRRDFYIYVCSWLYFSS